MHGWVTQQRQQRLPHHVQLFVHAQLFVRRQLDPEGTLQV
jgi:hypothetical protein